ncbi:PHD and RING finger domain-containing protein 1 [Culicoides brevitarsis]|uniref:PHD and RING finger domain-containing protein 1 n=1 Tax=Culicoides brevitarsis TaxID=469753 RepID=UPI00307B66F9
MEKEENENCENKREMVEENDTEDASSDEESESVADTSEASETDVSESRPSCPICLRSFSHQEIGFPEDCSSIQHIFCALCIEEWAKNVTTCPIDRKEFTKICILDNWLDKNVIRSVEVTRKEYNEQEMDTVDDLTYCEICHLANNEHSMLLCDGCDRGYHMDCLTPRLSEIPAGSWYCRLCVTNQEVGAQIVQNHEALGHLDGIDSDEADMPRIIRTRATERIRAAIMTRSDLLSDSEAEQATQAVSQPQPGPSRIRTTLERVRRALKRGTRKRRKRRTRRTAKRSTVVEEYDINSGDEKFPIKRTTRGRRVVRRKRKTKKRRTANQSCAFTIPNPSNSAAGINAMRYNAGVPTVRLFEPANNLEYFSDDENEEIMEAAPLTRQNASRDVLTAIQGMHRIGVNRNLLKRKVIAPPIQSSSSAVNLLDSIMENQEKWHSKKGVSDSCVLKGGKPVFNGKSENPSRNRPEIAQAALNGTGSNGTTINNQETNNESRSQNSTSTTAATTGSHQETNSTGNGAGGGNDGNEESTTQGRSVVNTFSPMPQRPQKTAASRKSFDIIGEDENKSCPNFSVYSSESMDLANQNTKPAEENDTENNEASDERVDLVQLSGDEEEEEETEKPTKDETTPENAENDAKETPTAEPEKPNANDTQGKSQVLHLYDSDGGLDEEINKHFTENSENYASQAPADRSYTPCLDEKYPNKEGEDGDLEKSGTSATGIDGMETELISEEEDSNMSARDADKNGDKSGEKSTPVTPFKKIQNTKDRNYRDKDRGGKRRHSRDRSEDKENKSKKGGNKKREIPRYNVREVITKASQRDPFGRTKPRERSRSKSPMRRRSRSRSRSKSRSHSWSRKSFTISRSPSYSPRPNKKTRTRSPSPRRRFAAGGRSKSPVRRIERPLRRSFSRSPSPRPSARSKSPFRRKESGKRKDKERKKKKNRSKERKSKRSQDGRRSSDVEAISWSNPTIRRTSITRHPSPSWTPPLGALKGSQENLRVVLQNRDAATVTSLRTKKKDKKKKSDKKKGKERREHGRHRHEKTESSKNRAPPTSKEVFASGDNILVSVSFNNTSAGDKQAPAQSTDKDREIRRVERDPTKTLQLKDPAMPRPAAVRKHRKIDTKPVAYIDLDGSPFNLAPASPVIVLSDSDHERDENAGATTDAHQTENEQIDECVRPASPPESPNAEEQFRLQAGPKTPPEPTTTSIKFSMPSKTRLRVLNNLFEDEDDEEPTPTNNARADKDASAAQKIGPNTPPDPTPKSPDVYDPFEPTKSPSESPGHDNDDHHDDGPLSRSSTPPLEDTQKMTDSDKLTQEKLNQLKPVDLVMQLVNKSLGNNDRQEKGEKVMTIDSIDELTETHLDGADVPVEKQITVLSNVVVQTPSKYNVKSTSQQNKQKLSIKSLNSLQQANTSGSIISKLPLPRTTSSKSHASTSAATTGGGAADMEIDSPYSPGSNDFDDLFEPPSSTTDNYKPSHSKNVSSSSGRVPPNKADLFDNLFGSSSPVHKFSTVTTTYKVNTKTTRGKPRKGAKRSKFDDDEVPNSAVDLQVKDKLLRKLNRQERVIEEVKLVIKPHYNKKRITKEEYKEIMRKAVPKICHSRTGEINPVKIQALVEAYVKKVRQRRKMANKMQSA